MTELRNTIICGDCLDVMRQMPDGCIDLVVTDPPYNVGKDYGDTTDDKRPEAEFLEWYSSVAEEVFRVHAGGYAYVSCSTPQIWTLRPVWEDAGFAFVMLLLWHGPNYAGNSNTIRGPWRLLYEPIFMLRKGARAPMLNEVRGINSDAILRFPRPQRNFKGLQRREHPTQKPVGLYRALIGRTPGAIVFDPFVGSGASAMAAKGLGRHYLGCDISQEYVDMANRRIAKITGVQLALPERRAAAARDRLLP